MKILSRYIWSCRPPSLKKRQRNILEVLRLPTGDYLSRILATTYIFQLSQMDRSQINEHLNFTVHNYTSVSRFLPAPKTTIEAGRKAIASGIFSDGWSSVNWDVDVSVYSVYLLFCPVK